MNLKNIGNNIKSLRLAKGFTQSQLAEKTDVSTVHISHIETGTVAMSLDLLINLSNCLNTSPNKILLGEYNLNSESTSSLLNKYVQDLTDDECRFIIEAAKLLKEIKLNRN